MKFRLEEKELVVNRLFGEKRYPFNKLTKLEICRGFRIYAGDKCILYEKNLNTALKCLPEIYKIALKYNLIIKDQDWFDDEISINDIHYYGTQVYEEILPLLKEFANRELGEGYELVIDVDESPYHINLFFDIYCNGVKMCMNDKEEVEMYSDYLMDDSKVFHLSGFELVMPEYVDPIKQEYKITKRVDFEYEINEIKQQIRKMKECGIVPASKFNA